MCYYCYKCKDFYSPTMDDRACSCGHEGRRVDDLIDNAEYKHGEDR